MMPLIIALGLLSPAQPPLPPLPAPLPVPLPLPAPPPAPLPVPERAIPVAPRAFTLAEFSRGFTPLPGKHEVWLVHPVTRQPALICFTLPPGRMKRFEVGDRYIEFNFDKCEVRIDFYRNGRIKVDHDN